MRVVTPEFDACVDRPWRENDHGAFGKKDSRDGRVAGCHTHGEWDGRIEAQDFGAERLEVGAVVNVGRMESFTVLLQFIRAIDEMLHGNICSDLVTDALLKHWVPAKLVD